MISKLSIRAVLSTRSIRPSQGHRLKSSPSKINISSYRFEKSKLNLTKLSKCLLSVRYSSTLASPSTTSAASEAVSNASNTVATTDPIAAAMSSLEGIAPVTAMGPDNFVASFISCYFLSMVHLATGVPWWVELSAAAFLVRLALLPFLIAQVKNAAVMEMLAPHIQRLTIAINTARKQNRVAEALFHTEGLNTLYKGHNVSILRNFQLSLMNIPLLFAFSNAIRVLVSYPQTLQDGGFSWLTNLTVADPYHVIPVVLVSLHLANIWMNRRIYKTKFSRWFMWLGIAFAAPLGALGYFAPAAYACYWIPSALFSLIMNALFLTRGFRRLCGIPTAPLDMDIEDTKWKAAKQKQDSTSAANNAAAAAETKSESGK